VAAQLLASQLRRVGQFYALRFFGQILPPLVTCTFYLLFSLPFFIDSFSSLILKWLKYDVTAIL
jgi:hypothetical protein